MVYVQIIKTDDVRFFDREPTPELKGYGLYIKLDLWMEGEVSNGKLNGQGAFEQAYVHGYTG